MCVLTTKQDTKAVTCLLGLIKIWVTEWAYNSFKPNNMVELAVGMSPSNR